MEIEKRKQVKRVKQNPMQGEPVVAMTRGAILALMRSQRISNTIALIMSVIALLLCLLLTAYYFSHTKAQYKYFATTEDGKIFNLTPMNQPLLSDTSVKAIANNAVQDVFAFNYLNYNHILSVSQKYFAPGAMKGFSEQMNQKGGIIDNVTQNKFIVTPIVSGAITLLKKGIIPGTGKYGWRLVVPLTLDFQSETEAYKSNYDCYINMIRVSQDNTPRGVAIQSIILKQSQQSE